MFNTFFGSACHVIFCLPNNASKHACIVLIQFQNFPKPLETTLHLAGLACYSKTVGVNFFWIKTHLKLVLKILTARLLCAQ